jgi:geranylgeranyl transferase type-1 subunit beta
MLGSFDSPQNLTQYSIDKHEIIAWIYSLQTHSHAQEPGIAGFKVGTFLSNMNKDECLYHNQGHLAMTYSALCTLITLGDDLERVDKKGIVKGLQYPQREGGR